MIKLRLITQTISDLASIIVTMIIARYTFQHYENIYFCAKNSYSNLYFEITQIKMEFWYRNAILQIIVSKFSVTVSWLSVISQMSLFYGNSTVRGKIVSLKCIRKKNLKMQLTQSHSHLSGRGNFYHNQP